MSRACLFLFLAVFCGLVSAETCQFANSVQVASTIHGTGTVTALPDRTVTATTTDHTSICLAVMPLYWASITSDWAYDAGVAGTVLAGSCSSHTTTGTTMYHEISWTTNDVACGGTGDTSLTVEQSIGVLLGCAVAGFLGGWGWRTVQDLLVQW